jgi:hypothetical protein
VDLFKRTQAMDAEVNRINGSAPSGHGRRLVRVELAARGLPAPLMKPRRCA